MTSINYISNLSNSYLQSLLGTTSSSSASNAASNVTSQTEAQLSPFAQLMSTLQQLQQSNPAEYKQVTAQIATNLQNAAKTATSDGYANMATQLNQLATDFSTASSNGQLPNIQDLAQAIGGHHHPHHGYAAASDSDASSDSTSAASSSQIDQLLSALQTSSTTSESLNPLAIIANTLAGAGTSSQS